MSEFMIMVENLWTITLWYLPEIPNLYWDEDSGEIMTINPNEIDAIDEGGFDMYNDNIIEVTINDVKRALYGKELSVYV